MVRYQSTPFLIVDDQAGLAKVLQGLGFESVEAAANGAAAMDLLHRLGPRFVLADLHMAPVSGLQMLRSIRSDRKLSESRFILIAATVTPAEATAVKQAGADGLILKPFTGTALVGKIEAVLAKQQGSTRGPMKPGPSKSLSASLGRRFERRWQ